MSKAASASRTKTAVASSKPNAAKSPGKTKKAVARSSSAKPAKTAAGARSTGHAAAPAEQGQDSASRQIDARIESLGDWRGDMLARIRALIRTAVPGVVEEWKWRGVPVWSYAGILCTGETYKDVVKTTFAKGAALDDPSALFNASLEGNTRRAIDFREGQKIDEKALKALVAAAAELNSTSRAGARSARPKDKARRT